MRTEDYEEAAAGLDDLHRQMRHEMTPPPEKLAVMNRRERRSHNRGRHVKHTGRASGKTGQPVWFRDMKWEAKEKRLLSKLPISALYDHQVCTGDQAVRMAEAGLRTVWDFVSTDYETLEGIPTFGPKVLAKIRQAAKIKQLNVKWSVPR